MFDGDFFQLRGWKNFSSGAIFRRSLFQGSGKDLTSFRRMCFEFLQNFLILYVCNTILVNEMKVYNIWIDEWAKKIGDENFL